ncbi:MAG: molybdenum cofactor biosysynthesis protein [Verrucomicrobia bacterium]|nr:MAG: molybdenum cofactor biosysynthesis protein [Verrucomicrobiota bacterium]
MPMFIRQIFISAGHSSTGPADFPLIELVKIECAAGRGVIGDRYFDLRENYKGQVTFFSAEVFERLCAEFGISSKSAGVLRRNVIVSDVDLSSLISREFEIQGVRFARASHCAPCRWMDTVLAPGEKKFLANNGGLRAQILSNGWIKIGAAQLIVSPPSS